jgi:hypothetical protein
VIRTRQGADHGIIAKPVGKNSKYEYCYHFSNSDFMPLEVDLDVGRPTAEELQTFIG